MVRPAEYRVDGSARPNHAFRLQGRAPGRQADAGERRVSQRGTALRPDERSDVGGPASGLERHDDQRAQSAAAAMRRLRCSTSPAAPATSRSAPPRRRARAFAPPSATSIPTCSRSAATRAAARHLDEQVSFVEGNAEALAFPDRAFDAYTIAFGIRNVPRIDLALREAYRVLKPGSRFLCLEFSTVDVPGLDRIYDLFSFKVIPPLGRAVTGDAESYQYLVESIRKFPQAERLCRDDPRRRLFARELAEPFRRHRGVAFGLAFVISAIDPHRAAGPRRFRVRARRRVRRGRSEPGAAARATRAAPRAADRAPRRQIRPATVAGADAARAGLSQARAVSRHPARRGRRHAWRATSKACRTGCRRSRKKRPKP